MAEFNYAREAAAQAMNDHQKLVNFYLIIVGLLITAVAHLLGMLNSGSIDESVANVSRTNASSILLGLLFLIGFLSLMKLVRLRQAWLESKQCMNQIKDYYQRRLGRNRLNRQAFRWTSETIPSAHKPWTVFFFSAILIVLLDSFALMGALLLASIKLPIILLTGLIAFIIQIGLHQYILKKGETINEWSRK